MSGNDAPDINFIIAVAGVGYCERLPLQLHTNQPLR
jgi:hypothetical protein